ncbi:malto-oligosyltrehalose synthase [Devosia sp. BK]|uniref:malto-oligosyltrehalose synthase n=1 Tax=Devosia sp. BK TaxID=2871706 RepID=UPI002939CF8C|nr:malto-oligosyltrehalose synthase [Devosia sp. BK]MDV3253309.1 malto-oligosyltrehalose synthase [Devosia sp. BK]
MPVYASDRDERPVPRASYRLQLNKDFGFSDAEKLAPYLGRLGISHAYLSPILKARPGSMHGYDTVDHTLVNPELGTLDGLRQMAAALRREGIGIILDIVPNHMGIGGAENPYWLNVLEWGRDSRYAYWFDINWAPSEPSLQDKVLMPFLGSALGEAIETGRMSLKFDDATGSFAIWAEDTHKLPIDPRHYAEILKHAGDIDEALLSGWGVDQDVAAQLKTRLAEARAPGIEMAVQHFNSEAGRQDLAELIAKQNWRAARYSVGADEINYRRFFIVSDLAAIRIERQEVFDHAHKLIFQLVEEGLVEGLRIDHIDGLYDPKQYTLRLRQACPRPIYLVVEKILAPGEALRSDWDIDGTTGYEFANVTAQLLVDPAAEGTLTEFYRDFTGETGTLDVLEREAKLEIIDYEMSAELDALTTRLTAIAGSHRASADLTRNGIRNALRHFLSCLSVYRTYVDGDTTASDRDDVEDALAEAQTMAPSLDGALFDFLRDVALLNIEGDHVLETAMRLQQFTGPAMAKGLEDTALYRYNRLIALSDVGERPDQFSASPDQFHAFNRDRAANFPGGMLTSSSHDTKRGEDVRSRIAAVSLLPEEWIAKVSEWRAHFGEEIDANDLYYFFQQLLGAWPAEFAGLGAIDPDKLETFRERTRGAMTKAVREARRHTTWTANSEDYEGALMAVVDQTLDPDGEFLADFRAFADEIGPLGARNSIIAATLKLTVPGMPDIYQGAELYEQSMVDPDNRRPVDFAERTALLNALPNDLSETMADWTSGKTKLGVISRLLALRKEIPNLFAKGRYEPIAFDEENSRAVGFLRRDGDAAILVLAWLGLPEDTPDLKVQLPSELAAGDWTNVFTGREVDSGSLNEILGEMPAAVLRLA